MISVEKLNEQVRDLGLAIAKEKMAIAGSTEFLIFCIRKTVGSRRFMELQHQWEQENERIGTDTTYTSGS